MAIVLDSGVLLNKCLRTLVRVGMAKMFCN